MIRLKYQRLVVLELSQTAFAEKAGLNKSTVSQIESGRLVPYPSQVEKLVAAIGWKGEPSELFEEVEVM